MSRRAVTAGLLASSLLPALPLAADTQRMPTRGFAIPGWISADPLPPSNETLMALRHKGFETVRLPIDFRDIGSDPLEPIEIALRMLSKAGFRTILDVHMGDASANEITSAWQSLAPLLADTDPDTVFAELLNEPQFETSDWLSLRASIAAIVRHRAPKHVLLWGPARVQGIWELEHEPPLDDDNSIAVVHYYWPMGFTHQCETWMRSAYSRFQDLPFPARYSDRPVQALANTLEPSGRSILETEFKTNWTTAAIAEHFATAAAWSRRHGIPLMLGEFGAARFCADAQSRATWTRAVREAAEFNGIGWVYWEVDRGFGFVTDRARHNSFDEGVIDALLS
ncbi:glycoside hydrolase family 5 protein [Devosia pacifica]|uniref:glycoside hydrolase family 5 protein n=1 Tax=Devosia pacifica TaxID=1335967 RepID=UPI0016737B11|nr:cellulase family glycosylhydrolase [Devosia pacifica]